MSQPPAIIERALLKCALGTAFMAQCLTAHLPAEEGMPQPVPSQDDGAIPRLVHVEEFEALVTNPPFTRTLR